MRAPTSCHSQMYVINTADKRTETEDFFKRTRHLKDNHKKIFTTLECNSSLSLEVHHGFIILLKVVLR